MQPLRERLEALLAQNGETALLRFSLGMACLEPAPHAAVSHFERAVALDPDYSAAWKQLGRAYCACSDPSAAAGAYRQGIEVAARRGDIQAAKEMRVFLKRVERS